MQHDPKSNYSLSFMNKGSENVIQDVNLENLILDHVKPPRPIFRTLLQILHIVLMEGFLKSFSHS